MCAASLLALAATAVAQPITDRDFAIDFYDGVAIGDTTQVGMGGAGAARINGSAGALLNPSAIAVRDTTDRGGWNGTYHLDALTASLSSDYDNNGITTTESDGASFLTFGLGLRVNTWAIAVTATAQTAPVSGGGQELDATALRGRFMIAKFLHSWDLAIGVGVQSVRFGLADGDDNLFGITGLGGLAGLTWVPKEASFRLGAAYESKIRGGDIDTTDCDPMNCRGYILPSSVESAERIIAGFAYRFGPTPWNVAVLTPYRDERALTFAADLILTGDSDNGYGIEAFGQQMLQRSGKNIALSARGGLDFEALPGRLRLRVGSYWEPPRFEDVPGRAHVTTGFDLRPLQFRFWGPRRFRVSGTADLANNYRNIGFSLGFWH